MRCPKDKECELESVKNSDRVMPSRSDCGKCGGQWISADDYANWQSNAQELVEPGFLAENEVSYNSSDLDVKAGLCPECGSYLTRLRLHYTLKSSFYLERCAGCGGFWCDRGEWEILTKLNWHRQLPHLFSSKWQIQLREKQKVELERQMVIEKLGADLAQQLFDLTEALEGHAQGSFAANYLSRQLEKSVKEQV
jgi:Zn-finger nucleic acid-binding protein